MKKLCYLFFLLSIFSLGGCGILGGNSQTVEQNSAEQTALSLTPSPTPSPTMTPTPLPAVRVQMADQSLLSGDYSQSRLGYQTALEQAGDDETRAAALLGLGKTDWMAGDCESALVSFNTMIQGYPDYKQTNQAYFLAGYCYQEMEDYQNAADSFNAYLKSAHPVALDTFAGELLGDALTALGDYGAAIEAYKNAETALKVGDSTSLEVKISQRYADLQDCQNAIEHYLEIYQTSGNDYVKAEMDLFAGRCYLTLGQPEQAYALFQDSVIHYPRAYDSYSQLVALVDAGQPVDDIYRGLVDYFAGQYGAAVDSFKRYLANTPNHDGTAHYYMALALREMGDHEQALAQWQALIDDHPGDHYYVDTWEDMAYTLWAYLGRYRQAAQTLLNFVDSSPSDPAAADMLFQAARIYERNGDLEDAAATWVRMIDEYPTDEQSLRGLFLAGITYYRLPNYGKALVTFQRVQLLATGAEDQAGALLWIGKVQNVQGETDKAAQTWQQAMEADPTGYYSFRARELISGYMPLFAAYPIDLGYNKEEEKAVAETWLRSTFSIPENEDLSGLGLLNSHPRLLLAEALWDLGFYSKAAAEFELVRQENTQDALASYRLMNYFLDLGVNRQAILACRQILELAQISDTQSLESLKYFSHIRFGGYFKDIVFPVADETDLSPSFLFGVIRQESLFEGFAGSSAGAIGLMQLIPSTGQDMVDVINWPADYQTSDLYRPLVNVRLGATYLQRQLKTFGTENPYIVLAAYNAGPSSARIWNDLAGNDPDLFLEVIRYAETRTYVMQVAENTHIYQYLYEKAP